MLIVVLGWAELSNLIWHILEILRDFSLNYLLDSRKDFKQLLTRIRISEGDTMFSAIAWAYCGHSYVKGTQANTPSLSGALCNIKYTSKTHLKLKSREDSFACNLCSNCPIVFFAQGTAVFCERVLRRKTNSWDLSLRCISDGYPISYSPPPYHHPSSNLNYARLYYRHYI